MDGSSAAANHFVFCMWLPPFFRRRPGGDEVPDDGDEVVVTFEEGAKRYPGGAIVVEVVDRHAVVQIRFSKIGNVVEKGVDIGLIDRFVHSVRYRNVTRVNPLLPEVGNREDDVAAEEFAPVVVVPERAEKEPRPVSAFPVQAVGPFRHGHAGPFQTFRIDKGTGGGDCLFYPVVGAADHDGADRPQPVDRQALGLPPFKALFHRLRHGQGLGNGEADRGVDADAPVGRFRYCLDARGGGRNLHLNVRGEAAEVNRLFDDAAGVPVVFRVRLDGEKSLTAFLPLVNGEEHFRAFDSHRLDKLPGQIVFAGFRIFAGQILQKRAPQRHFRLENGKDDGRVGGGADGAVPDGVFEFADGTGVVPEIGAAKTGGLLKRRFLCGHGSLQS
ncbi:MAG: hypothetical protein LUG50_05045 [Planctomycetaceae bacterium]|nr:hypothetical protein [Planctomycetaceae bacterium]